MENFMKKDRFTYQQESQKFMEDLRKFHTSRGTPFYKIPLIQGKPVDLYLLYTTVTNLGGWNKINVTEEWDDIHHLFHIPKACANASQALKEVYIRYLHLYERVRFHGADLDNADGGEDEEEDRMMRRKRANTPVSSMAMSYNYRQHEIPDTLRGHLGLSLDIVQKSDYHKLEKSLMSGLANEVDFAINVVTLLSNEGKHIIHLSHAPLILHLLMAQVGIFTEGPSGFKDLYEDDWRTHLKRNFIKFWFDTVEDKEIKELISPCSEYYEKDKLLDVTDYNGKGVLNLDRDLGISDLEGQRVLQIAVILRNLSFEQENSLVLANHPTAFRFLMLCAHNKYSSLKQIGLDTLGNIALQLTLDPIDFRNTQLVLRTITRCLGSSDKFEVVRGMEILGKLCQVECNEEIVTSSLEPKAYSDLAGLLTVQDIQLIVYALESLYQLSELGEEACNGIANSKRCVDTLVDLVTIEAGSYGPGALQGIKVIEHYEMVPISPHALATQSDNRLPAAPIQGQTYQSIPRPVAVDPQTYACNWLKSNYETQPGKVTSRADVYSSFLHCCSKHGQTSVLPADNFFNCVRMLFPNLEVTKLDPQGSGSGELFFKGIGKKGAPPPVSHQPVPAKPPSSVMQPHHLPDHSCQPPPSKPPSVLQQQLMAPPQNVLAFQQRLQQQMSPNKPPPSSSHTAKSSQSNLIKSLLASKLSHTATARDQPSTAAQCTSTPPKTNQAPCSDRNPLTNPLLARGLPASGFVETLQQTLSFTESSVNRGGGSRKSPASSPSRSSSPRSAKGASPRRSSSPRSPRSYQLEVCSQVERAQDVVLHHEVVEEAKIERIENITHIQSGAAPPFVPSEDNRQNKMSPTKNGESQHKGLLNGLPNGDLTNGERDSSEVNVNISLKKQELVAKMTEAVDLKEHCLMNGLVNHLPNGDIDSILNASDKLRTKTKLNGIGHVTENGALPEELETPKVLSSKLDISGDNMTKGDCNTGHVVTKDVMSPVGNALRGDNGIIASTTDEKTCSLEEVAHGNNGPITSAGNDNTCAVACGKSDDNSPEDAVKSVAMCPTADASGGDMCPTADVSGDDNSRKDATPSGDTCPTTDVSDNDNSPKDAVSSDGARLDCHPNVSSMKGDCQSADVTSGANTHIGSATNAKNIKNSPLPNGTESDLQATIPVVETSSEGIPCENIDAVTVNNLIDKSVTSGAKSEVRMDVDQDDGPTSAPEGSGSQGTPGRVDVQTTELASQSVDGAVKRQHSVDETSKPKKKKSKKTDSRRSSTSSIASLVLGDYVCDWANCKKSFDSARATLVHACKTHITGDGLCLWENCDKLHRKKLSLVTHIQDRHCTEQALKGAAMRRQVMSTPNGTPVPSPAPPPSPAAPPPVYANDAASQAIKRLAVQQPYPELLEAKEGPVTKHIRLTSSLILRNLARYSSHGRTIIKKHEHLLAYIAMSAVESSAAISNCLWEIINNH